MIQLSSNIYIHLKQGNIPAFDCAVLGIKILCEGSGSVTVYTLRHFTISAGTLFTPQQSLSAN